MEENNVTQNVNASEKALPTKVGPWTKVKNFLFQEVKIEMTPKQEKVLTEVRDFWCQDVTKEKVHNILFHEITAQSMKDFWFQKIEITL